MILRLCILGTEVLEIHLGKSPEETWTMDITDAMAPDE